MKQVEAFFGCAFISSLIATIAAFLTGTITLSSIGNFLGSFITISTLNELAKGILTVLGVPGLIITIIIIIAGAIYASRNPRP